MGKAHTTAVPGKRDFRRLEWRTALVLAGALACSPCAFALDPSLDVGQYAHTSWKNSEGFGRGDIWEIAQTPDGYLWLATEFGLRRFDGVRTADWQAPAGEHLPSSDIRSLIAARDGTLWIGTAKGLVSWKDGKLTHYPELDKHDVHSLMADREGAVWVAATIWAEGPSTPGKLCEISRGGVHCFGSDGRFGPFGVTGLYEDSRRNLWLGAANGLWRLKPGVPEHFPVPELKHYGMANLVFPRRSFLEDSRGALLITGPRGIRRFKDGKISPYPPLSGELQFDDGKLLQDRDGNLWIGTSDAGLFHIHQGRVDVFAQPDGLSSNVVQDLFEDREGNVWVATSNGLDSFRDLAVPTISVKQGLSTPFVTSVLASKDGSVWLGTIDGLNRWKDGQITVYRKPAAGAGTSQSAGSIGAGPKFYPTPDGGVRQLTVSGLPDNHIGSLYQEPGGRIWISTARGLAYFEEGRFTSFSGVHIEEWFLSPVARDSAGNLWMTSDKGFYRLSGGRVAEFWPSSKVGLRGELSGLLLPDPVDGGLWLASLEGGVVYFKDGQVRASYAPSDGLGQGAVDELKLDSANTLWAVTEGGLSRIKNGHIATLTTKNGLPCDQLYNIVQDDAHSLWMYTACGLMRISKTELDRWVADPARQIRATVFDISDGVKTHAGVLQYAPRVTKAADGKVWLVTFDGVSVVDPEHLPFNKLPPPVHIEQIIADGKTYWQNFSDDTSSHLKLPPRVRDLIIDYTALSMVVPGKVRFRFELEGQDPGWREVVNRRRVEYSNLPPGKHRFRVIACNNSGVWNEVGDTLDFSIAPTYYQTTWFRASCVAAFLLLLWALYRYRLHQIAEKLNARLEGRVDERLRVARELHDTLLQSFQGLMLRFQAAVNLLPGRAADARQVLEAAVDDATQAITEARNAVQELRASTVVTNDLAKAIEALGEELAHQGAVNGDTTAFTIDVEGSPQELHPILRDEIYRIAGEALRNTFHHARARRIEVEIQYDTRELRVRVRDDGIGIDASVLGQEGRPAHWGLKGMRERAKSIGGQLEVWSERGAGTEIELTIPSSVAYEAHAGRRFRLFNRQAGTNS